MGESIIEGLFKEYISHFPNVKSEEDMDYIRKLYFGSFGHFILFIKTETLKDPKVAIHKLGQIEEELKEYYKTQIDNYTNKKQ